MKASFESLGSSTHASFWVRRFEEKYFSAPFHFHPEYELTLIVRGTGKRYVGAHMCDYFPEDLVLLGANLPHCWKTAPSETEESSHSIVIQFRHEFMGADLFDRPELDRVAQLLKESKCGIQFKGATQPLQEKIGRLAQEENGLKKLILLLDILHALASWPDYQLLDRQEVFPRLSNPEKERMNAIIAYIVENFQTEISLQKAASIANMTHYAFCRYFKRINRKTFMEVVIDYRIDFAMRQLIYTNKSISRIAFDCGFNDISNFHKTFKTRLHASPLHYRKQFTALTTI
jgi:AraC-like DNA-binding protein